MTTLNTLLIGIVIGLYLSTFDGWQLTVFEHGKWIWEWEKME